MNYPIQWPGYRALISMKTELIDDLLKYTITALLILSAASINAQQHSYAPSDIEKGRGLYQANCLGCHGSNGDAVEGVMLATGRFRHARSDEDLITLIRIGIPDTLMIARPQFSYNELRALVAFVRTMQSGGALAPQDVSIGDALSGQRLFYAKGQCFTCHGVNGGGSRLYPDLAGIGSKRSAGSLQQSILEPRAVVREEHRFYQVTTTAGQIITGKLMNQDTHSVQLMISEKKLVSLGEDEISTRGFISTPMRSYLNLLSADEVADLVAYLLSLKTK
ncbi:MAG: putative heme-binding domain-containing protein [Planctomycetota bacterium]|jgi:putative heme-binding domain-containing protein